MLEDHDFFTPNEKELGDDFLFVIKKKVIIEQWKKRKYFKERRYRKEKNGLGRGNVGGIISALVKNFREKLQVQAADVKKPKVKKMDDKETRTLKKRIMEELGKTMEMVRLEDRSGIKMDGFEIVEEEEKFVVEFLEKFAVISESSSRDTIDIMLMLKALPNKIKPYQLNYALMFSFRTF